MRLSFKIMSFVFLEIFVLLGIDGYLSVNREIELYEYDMRRDTILLGHALRQLVLEAWRHNGAAHALELIEEVNKDKEHQVKIRWVWLDVPPGDAFAPRVSKDKWDTVRSGHEICFTENRESGQGQIYTYVPLQVENDRMGALELSESLAILEAYIGQTIIWSTILTISLLSLGGILIWILGSKFIGRPLKQLILKTQKIGAGDLKADLKLAGHDELSELAVAMNQMCEQLTGAREAVRTETEARIAALEQLRHSERLATIGRLSAGIAHELGTPLNVVMGRAKLIAKGNLEKEEISNNSRIIDEQAQRMTRIMQQLLDFARRRITKRAPCDLRLVLAQVIELLNAVARKQRVTFELIENGTIPAIAADQAQMQQVFTNLVMNGIQAMPAGGRLELGIGVERTRPPIRDGSLEKDLLALRVRDEGIGISKENQKKIFDPFFTTKEVGQGTGLGLSIASGIVEEHGGWIEVESEPGKGACFTVYLPLELIP